MIPMNRFFVSFTTFGLRRSSALLPNSSTKFKFSRFSFSSSASVNHPIIQKKVGILLEDESREASLEGARLSSVFGDAPIIGRYQIFDVI
jgi:hypothetical protein